MSRMIVYTPYSSPDGHTYMKCKRCKQEFYIVSAAVYHKTVCFCPYCGQEANPRRKYDPDDYENYCNEMLNG